MSMRTRAVPFDSEHKCKGRLHHGGLCVNYPGFTNQRLFEIDHSEVAIRVAGTGGEEKLILLAVR